MPIFDFRCTECGHLSEHLVRGETSPVCPGCGGTQLDKLVSRPAAPGKSKALVEAARTRARAEGHFSND